MTTLVRVVAAAPGRVNLIGEHTDYNGGFALPLALPRRTLATVRPRDDGRVRAWSTAEGADMVEFNASPHLGDVTGWAAYVAGVFWALRKAGHPVPGADIEVDSNVPAGAGLSSSAALECAVIVALDHFAGLGLDATTKAMLCQHAENEYVGAPTGAMDQMAAMHGRAGHVILFDAAQVSADVVPCDLAGSGLALVIIDTRAPHRHADGEYGLRRQTCEEAARQLGVSTLRDVQDLHMSDVLTRLGAPPDSGPATRGSGPEIVRRVRHVLSENTRVLDTVDLLRAGRLAEIGPLLTASHASLRDDYEVTVPELDVAVEAALEAGALGARMTGGGFGGSVIALVAEGDADAVAAGVRTAFHLRGFPEPYAFTATPAAGAGIVDAS